MATPETRTPGINPADWRIDTCERCGKPDAVKRRTKRRPCTSCRLRVAAAHATARAKLLSDAADRAFLQRRQLVMDVEDARTALVEARHAERDAGTCGAIDRVCGGLRSTDDDGYLWPWLRCVDAGASCDAPPPCFKLRRNIKARSALAHARAAMRASDAARPNHGSPTKWARYALVDFAMRWAASGTHGRADWYAPETINAAKAGGDARCV